jgi:hypothetical protein
MQKSRQAATTEENILLRKACSGFYIRARFKVAQLQKEHTQDVVLLHSMASRLSVLEKKLAKHIADMV